MPVVVEADLAIVVDGEVGGIPFHRVGVELSDVDDAIISRHILRCAGVVVVDEGHYEIGVLAVELSKVDFARSRPDGAIQRLIVGPQPKCLLQARHRDIRQTRTYFEDAIRLAKAIDGRHHARGEGGLIRQTS